MKKRILQTVRKLKDLKAVKRLKNLRKGQKLRKGLLAVGESLLLALLLAFGPAANVQAANEDIDLAATGAVQVMDYAELSRVLNPTAQNVWAARQTVPPHVDGDLITGLIRESGAKIELTDSIEFVGSISPALRREIVVTGSGTTYDDNGPDSYLTSLYIDGNGHTFYLNNHNFIFGHTSNLNNELNLSDMTLDSTSTAVGEGTFEIGRAVGGTANLNLTNVDVLGVKITGGTTVNVNGPVTFDGRQHTYAGDTVLNGALDVTSANTLSSASMIAGNGTLNMYGNDQTVKGLNGSANINLDNDGVNAGILTIAGQGGDFSGIISGLGGLTLAENATQTLNNTDADDVNTYTGVTKINQDATLSIKGFNTIASSENLIVDGTIEAAGTQSVNKLTGNGTVSVLANENTVLTINGADFDGEVFAGNNSTTNFNGGEYNGNITGSGADENVIFNFNGGEDGIVISGNISNLGTGSENNLSGNVTLTGGNFGQTFNALGGTVAVDYGYNLGGTQNVLGDTTYSGLVPNANWNTDFNISASTTAAFDTTGNDIGLMLSGNITGDATAKVDIDGTGGAIFGGLVKDFKGEINVNDSATLELRFVNVISNAAKLTIADDATVKDSMGAQLIQSLNGGGDLIGRDFPGDTVFTIQGGDFAGSIKDGGGGATSVTVEGDLTLSGTNTYSGATTVEDGYSLNAGAANAFSADSTGSVYNGAVNLNGFDQTIQAIDGAATGTFDITGATLTLDGGSGTYAGVIGGKDGNLVVTAPTAQVLTGKNTYTGSTDIQGYVAITGDGSIASSSNVNVDGTLTSDNTHTVHELTGDGRVLVSGGSITIDGANFNGTLDNSAGGQINLFNDVTLTGDNRGSDMTSSGGTITGGQYGLGDSQYVGEDTTYQSADGKPWLTDFHLLPTITDPSVNANVTYDTTNGNDITLSGDITGFGDVVIKGVNGTSVTMDTVAKHYGGETDIQSGTLILAVDNAIDLSSGVTVAKGAQLVNAGSTQVLQSVIGEGTIHNESTAAVMTIEATGPGIDDVLHADILNDGTLTIEKGNYDGVISGLGSATFAVDGDLAIGSAQKYTGTTTVGDGANAGVLTLTADNALAPSVAVNVNKSAAIDIGNTTQTLNSLQGDGELNMAGGTAILTGTSTATVNATGGSVYAETLNGDQNVTADTTYRTNGKDEAWAANFKVGDGANDGVAVTFDSRKGNIDLNGVIANEGTTNRDGDEFKGNVVVDGDKIVTMNAVNTYTGSTAVNGGTLVIGEAGSIDDSESVFLKKGADLVSKSDDATEKNYNYLHGEGTFHNEGLAAINNGDTLFDGTLHGDTFDGDIKNHGVLTLNGGIYNGAISENGTIYIGDVVRADVDPSMYKGAVQLNNVNTYTGDTRLGKDSQLILTVDNAIASSREIWTGDNDPDFSSIINMDGTSQSFKRITGYGGISLGNGGVLTVESGDFYGQIFDVEIAGVVVGTGDFVKDGPGSLTLHQAQAYHGTTTLNNGKTTLGVFSGLSIGDNEARDAFAKSSGVYIGKDAVLRDSSAYWDSVAGGEFTRGLQSFQQLSGEGQLIATDGAGSDFFITGQLDSQSGELKNADGGRFDGGIQDSLIGDKSIGEGTASLTVNQGVVFRLGGEGLNTYTGKTTVAGTLIAESHNAFAAGSTHNVTGKLELHDNNVTIGALEGSGLVSLGTGYLTTNGKPSQGEPVVTNTTFNGVIYGDGGLNVAGGEDAVSLTLSNQNLYTGKTTVYGDLILSAENAIAESSQLHLAANDTAGIDNNGTVDMGATDQLLQYVTGTGTVKNTGTSVVEILDADTKANFVLNGKDAILHQGVYNGVIEGTSAVTKVGGGTLTLNAANAFTGGLFTDGGTVEIGNDAALGGVNGDGTVNVVSDTTFATINGAKTVENNFVINSDGNPPQTAAFDTTHGMLTIDGEIEGDGNIRKVGSGSLVLGYQNDDFSGKTYVDSGRLTFTVDNAIANSDELQVKKDAIFDLDTTTQTVNAGRISGDLEGKEGSMLVKAGNGTLTVDSENTDYAGTTQINGGTLSINNGKALGDEFANLVTIDGGNFLMTEDMALANGIKVSSNEANKITVADGKSVHHTGMIADDVTPTAAGEGGTFTKVGGGTLVVDGAGNTGATYIHGGTLEAGKADALSVNSVYSLDYSGVLDLGGMDQTVAMVEGTPNSEVKLGNGTLTLGTTDGYYGVDLTNDRGEYVYAGTISGDSVYLPEGQFSGIDKVGQTTWVLTGKNTYAGQTRFTDGIVKITEDANLGDGGQWVLNGGLLNINGTFETDRNVVVTNRTWNDGYPTTDPNGILVEAGQVVTLNGIISDFEGDNGLGDFNKWGDGKLIVLGKNTNNWTQVEEGILEGNTDSLQGNIGICDHATLVFNQNFDGTFNYRDGAFISGDISSHDYTTDDAYGTIEKIGTGTVSIVTNNSWFYGTTNVKAGEWRVAKMYTLGHCDEATVAGNGKHGVLSAGILGGNVVVAPVDGSGDSPILSGNGTILGNVTVMTNGILAPKNLAADWHWKNWDTNEFDGVDPETGEPIVNPNFANSTELALNIGGSLTFEKTAYQEGRFNCTNASDNAGTFMVGIAHYTNGKGVGVNDYVHMGGEGSVVSIVEGNLATGELGTQLVVNTFSDRCAFNFAYVNGVTYTIIDNAEAINGDFQKRYSAEQVNTHSKDVDWSVYRSLLDEEGNDTDESIAYRQRYELLDVANIGTEYVPRFLAFRGEIVDDPNHEGMKRYDLVLGKSDWDFHTPVEETPVSGTTKPYKAGSHNQSQVGNALNCMLTTIGNRYDSVTGQWSTYDAETGTWSNEFAYRDSLWNAALCNLGDPSITVEQYRIAYDQLAGDIRANSIYMGLVSHYRNAFNHITFDRFSGGPCSGCGDLGCDDLSCTPHCGTHTKKRDVWFEGTYDALRLKSDGNAHGFHMDGGGFMAGLGRKVGNNGRLGLMVGYSHPELRSRYGKIKADDFTIGLYGGARVHTSHRCIRTLDFLGYVGGGFQDYDSNRRIDSEILVDTPANLRSSYKGQSLEMSGEVALPWEIARNRFLLRPYLGLDYRRARQDGSTESGHDIYALRYSSQSMDQLFLRLGIGTELNPHRYLAFRARFGWDYQMLSNDRPEQNARFVGDGYSCNMNIWGLKQGDSRFNAAVNAQWYLNSCKSFSILGDYEVSAMDRGNGHQASLGLNWNF